MSNKILIQKIHTLINLHKSGALGGEVMPEDENPGFPKHAQENYLYFTLPMALNYQRNSYKLWEAANKSYRDSETSDIFNPQKVLRMTDEVLRFQLLKHKVALQPNKHIQIWRIISQTIVRDFNSDLRNLFVRTGYDVQRIKEYVLSHKKDFPYLGGSKTLNYWLYVMEQYTDARFKNRDCITIAPDTHVIQASVKLGLMTEQEAADLKSRDILAEKWADLLKDDAVSPIDIHTPLWLWSRGGFKQDI